jgi:predicted nucleic acid-binding protein
LSLVLVDTSIWIELLRQGGPRPSDLDLIRIVTCGPVVQEVFQGLRESAEARMFMDAFDAFTCLADPLPKNMFAKAATIYRSGRRRGLTIRSTVDCLIAAIAIEYEVPVWHRDRDFDAIARYTDLQISPGMDV